MHNQATCRDWREDGCAFPVCGCFDDDEPAGPQYETHGTLAEMTAERDSWRRVAERLEMEKLHYRAGLEHIAKTWAEGNGAGPAAKRVLETAPAMTRS